MVSHFADSTSSPKASLCGPGTGSAFAGSVAPLPMDSTHAVLVFLVAWLWLGVAAVPVPAILAGKSFRHRFLTTATQAPAPTKTTGCAQSESPPNEYAPNSKYNQT